VSLLKLEREGKEKEKDGDGTSGALAERVGIAKHLMVVRNSSTVHRLCLQPSRRDGRE